MNQPPVFALRSVYRTYSGFPISFAAVASDPDASLLRYSSSALPDGAQLDASSGLFEWTPLATQLGAFVVPIEVQDDGAPPLGSTTALGFKVQPLDSCVIPTCNPATGCRYSLPSLGSPCCAAGPVQPRVPEPALGCPAARVVHVGRNAAGFGRLQNCDALQAFNSGQVGVTMRFNIETRCFDISTPRQVTARLATAHRLLFSFTRSLNFADRGDGYGQRLLLTQAVDGPSPFFDLDHAEANLEVTVVDSDGSTATERVRVVLQFAALGDLEETR